MHWRCHYLPWHRLRTLKRDIGPGAVDLLRCSCGRLYAMNHDVRVVLPWHEVAHFYRDANNPKKGT